MCGLKWSYCGGQLASGGNDNILCIHDAGFRLQHKINAHQAAVKALAWCPFQVLEGWRHGGSVNVLPSYISHLFTLAAQSNLLATGGGTADRCIKFWNTHTGAMLSSIDTGSQVRAPCDDCLSSDSAGLLAGLCVAVEQT